MTVYLDVLIMENLIVNFFLLHITANTVKIKVKLRYIALGACIGCIYAVLMLYPVGKYASSIPIKLLIAVVMTMAVFRKRNLLFIIKSSAIFILYSMLLAGVCIFITLNENGFNIQNNLIINFTYKKLLLALMIIYIVIERLVVYVKDRKELEKLVFTVDIVFNDLQKSVTAFLDTGNELREPATNLPVIIVEKEIFDDLIVPKDKEFYVSYTVVNGYNGKLRGFKPDNVKVHFDKKEIKDVEAIIAFCDNKLSNLGEYNALLSRGILQ